MIATDTLLSHTEPPILTEFVPAPIKDMEEVKFSCKQSARYFAYSQAHHRPQSRKLATAIIEKF
jgi:hypothetical protein